MLPKNAAIGNYYRFLTFPFIFFDKRNGKSTVYFKFNEQHPSLTVTQRNSRAVCTAVSWNPPQQGYNLSFNRLI